MFLFTQRISGVTSMLSLPMHPIPSSLLADLANCKDPPPAHIHTRPTPNALAGLSPRYVRGRAFPDKTPSLACANPYTSYIAEGAHCRRYPTFPLHRHDLGEHRFTELPLQSTFAFAQRGLAQAPCTHTHALTSLADTRLNMRAARNEYRNNAASSIFSLA